MSDYISRKAAVKIAQKYGLANGSALGRHTGLADCIAIEIEGLPAADVAEVRHGEWRLIRRMAACGEYECSVCGRIETFFALTSQRIIHIAIAAQKWIWRNNHGSVYENINFCGCVNGRLQR